MASLQHAKLRAMKRTALPPPIRSPRRAADRRSSLSNSFRRRPRRWRSVCGDDHPAQWLAPRFVSVTYGAGGTTRERTHATVARIRRETRLEPAAHLTCVGASRAEIDAIAQRYWEAGIRHIVALRGDRRPTAPATRAARRLRPCGRPRRRAPPCRRFRDQRRGVPGGASRGDQRRRRSRQSQAQDRRRRDRAITQFFFDVTSTCASSSVCAPPASPCRSCPASCR